ncbi:MAG: phage tail protein [Caulobacteraceae bacterium]
MSAFGGLIFTNKGRNLQAKAQAGAQLNFTRVAVGDGDLGGSSIADLNALVHQVKTISITKLSVLVDGKAVIGGAFSNQDLVAGFYWKELGVFAQDPDLGEILYCYGNSGANAEYIPAGGGPDVVEKSIDVVTIVGNAATVTATIEQSLVHYTQNDVLTVDQTQAPASPGNGKISQLFNWLANRIKAITGKPNWWDAPTKNLEELNTALTTHSADYTLQVPYAGTTTGTANTYAISTPAIAALTAGMAVSLKFNVDSTAASTLDWNGKGAKGIKKSNGTDATNLKATGIYTLRYDGANFILQGEGASGNATASDLLSGKTASTDAGDIVGTMPNNGSLGTIIPSTVNQNIPAGYTSGGIITGDTNLVAGNIKNGVGIFGVVGNLQSKQYASGTITSTTGTYTFENNVGGYVNSHSAIVVTGLQFQPKLIICRYPNGKSVTVYTENILTFDGSTTKILEALNAGITFYKVGTQAAVVNATGFTLPVTHASQLYEWEAYA